MQKTITCFAIFMIASTAYLLITSPLYREPFRCDNHIYSESLGIINLGEVIGHGSFSLVMSGTAVTSGKSVAVKLGISEMAGVHNDVLILSAVNGSESFPLYYGSGTTTCATRLTKNIRRYPYIVLERLGEPVASIMSTIFDREARIEIALLIGVQILNGLEELHKLGYIIHDLYGQNVLFIKSQKREDYRIKLIDFGEMLSYPAFSYKSLNNQYTSVREDAGLLLSQRDDLERLVFLMMEVIDGGLPWRNYAPEQRAAVKSEFSLVSNSYPSALVAFLDYARNKLRLSEEIDFVYCRMLLVSL